MRRPPPTGRLFVSPRQEERKEREGEKDTFSRECFLSQFVKVLVLQIYPLCISPPLLPLLLDAEREGETGSVCGQRGGVPGLVLHTGEDSSDIPGICNTVRKVLADFAIFN